jgi:DNA-binding winged helix-turn-helix (wHTH) protein
MKLHANRDGMIALDGKPLPLPPKERAVLAALLAAFPEPVSKDRFADEVWGGPEMSDESLARSISQLRRLLPVGAGVGIRSVYGYGYQLVVRGTELSASLPERHLRLVDIAEGTPSQVEALLHARSLSQSRSMANQETAASILRNELALAPSYLPARILLAETLALIASSSDCRYGELLDEARCHLSFVETAACGMAGLDAVTGRVFDLQWLHTEAATRHGRAAAERHGDAAGHAYRARHLTVAGDLRGAIAEARAAIALLPHSLSHVELLVRILHAAGETAEAAAVLLRHQPEADRDMLARSAFGGLRAVVMGAVGSDAESAHTAVLDIDLHAAAELAFLLALRGDRDGALALLDCYSGPEQGAARHVTFAPVLIRLGLIEEAMCRVEQAIVLRVPFLPELLTRPEMEELARHHRHTPMMAAMRGVPGAARSPARQIRGTVHPTTESRYAPRPAVKPLTGAPARIALPAR